MPFSATARSSSSKRAMSPATKETLAIASSDNRLRKRWDSRSTSKIQGRSPRSAKFLTTHAPINPLAPVIRKRRLFEDGSVFCTWYLPPRVTSELHCRVATVYHQHGRRLCRKLRLMPKIKTQKRLRWPSPRALTRSLPLLGVDLLECFSGLFHVLVSRRGSDAAGTNAIDADIGRQNPRPCCVSFAQAQPSWRCR